jgi:predicted RecB family nuclease
MRPEVMDTSGRMQRRRKDWVSKTDVIRYRRCPYAFWLLDQGIVRLEDAIGTSGTELLETGVAFEAGILEGIDAIDVTPETLPKILKSSIRLYDPPLFRNEDLALWGRPDAIVTSRGQLIPVEIKAHRHPKLTDILELAFYWRLLEPHRTRRAKPRGILILRAPDGTEEEREIEIDDEHLATVEQLIANVRTARRDGVIPEYCKCVICAGRPEVIEACIERGAPSLLYGIASSRAKALASIGIRTLQDILSCDPESTRVALRPYKHFVSASTIGQWKRHIRSYEVNAPIMIGEEAIPFADFIAVDFEYDSCMDGNIWLIGIAVVENGVADVSQFWADDETAVRRNLKKFAKLLASKPALPIVTWSGSSAEIPQIRVAAAYHDLVPDLQPVLDRHYDLFAYADANVRLPIPTLDLKSVGNYFGFYQTTQVRSGFEAAYLHRRHRKAANRKERADLKRMLMDYNREDVEALVHVVRRFRDLASIPVDRIFENHVQRI